MITLQAGMTIFRNARLRFNVASGWLKFLLIEFDQTLQMQAMKSPDSGIKHVVGRTSHPCMHIGIWIRAESLLEAAMLSIQELDDLRTHKLRDFDLWSLQAHHIADIQLKAKLLRKTLRNMQSLLIIYLGVWIRNPAHSFDSRLFRPIMIHGTHFGVTTISCTCKTLVKCGDFIPVLWWILLVLVPS